MDTKLNVTQQLLSLRRLLVLLAALGKELPAG